MSGAERSEAAVVIGRFRFLHRGHLAVMLRGLALARRLIVIVGSCDEARTPRTPLTFLEVREMIEGALGSAERGKVTMAGVIDHGDRARRKRAIEAAVAGASGGAGRILRVGRGQDFSGDSGYDFPQWARAEVAAVEGLSAQVIREAYFIDAGRTLEEWAGAMPRNVVAFLSEFATRDIYAELAAEAANLREWRRDWAATPYPPIFVTVDAVVVARQHVLLVERGRRPGKGLWALPGGFVESGEPIRTAMLRELAEETGIRVSEAVVAGAVRAVRVFDDPWRSARGRIVTHAFLVMLPEACGIPAVAGSDDAARAFWQPLGEIERVRMYEDHAEIIETMLGAAEQSREGRE